MGPDSSDAQPIPKFGGKLRRARQRARLTQLELAERVGVSKGFISQLENDASQVSVANLIRICRAVGIDIASLFDGPGESLVRRSERLPVNLGGHGVRDVLLTPPDVQSLRLVEATLAPLATAGDEFYAMDCDMQCVLVQEGIFELELLGEHLVLEEGDSMTFAGRVPRRWRNPQPDKSTRVLWALTQS